MLSPRSLAKKQMINIWHQNKTIKHVVFELLLHHEKNDNILISKARITGGVENNHNTLVNNSQPKYKHKYIHQLCLPLLSADNLDKYWA